MMQQQVEKQVEKPESEEEIQSGLRAKPFKQSVLPYLTATAAFPIAYLVMKSLVPHDKVFGLVMFWVLGTVCIAALAYLLLSWFRHWTRMDAQGIHWQTIWGKKQFGRWEDVEDYYLQVAPPLPAMPAHLQPPQSIVVFQDGRKLRLIHDLTNPQLTTDMRKRITEKTPHLNLVFWETQGIRTQENWNYTYHFPEKYQSKQVVRLASGFLLLLLPPLLMFAIGFIQGFFPSLPSFIFVSLLILGLVGLISGLALLVLSASNLFQWFKLKPFWKTQITVDREGLSWTDANGSGSASWEQVIALRREGAVASDKVCYVMSLAGKEETEIRFPGATSFRDYSSLKQRRVPLETIIQTYGIGARDKEIEQDDEVIGTAVPQSIYPIAGAKVFSYNTISLREGRKKILPGIFAIPAFTLFLFTTTKNAPNLAFIGILGLMMFSFVLLIWIYALMAWQSKLQIEADDLGIALITPRGIKWRLSWLSVVKHQREMGKGLVLTTRDGKTYTCPHGMARSEELIAEIDRRVAMNNPKISGKR
jgi:hypothetical protein